MKKNWIKRVAFLFATVVITAVSFDLMAPPPPPPPPPMPTNLNPQTFATAKTPTPVPQAKFTAGSGNTNPGNLLAEIAAGKTLRNTETKDKSGPSIPVAKQTETNAPQGPIGASSNITKQKSGSQPISNDDLAIAIAQLKPKSQIAIALAKRNRATQDPNDEDQSDDDGSWDQNDNLVALTASLSILNSITKSTKPKPPVSPKSKPQSPSSHTNAKTPELSPTESKIPKFLDPTQRTPPTVLPKSTSSTSFQAPGSPPAGSEASVLINGQYVNSKTIINWSQEPKNQAWLMSEDGQEWIEKYQKWLKEHELFYRPADRQIAHFIQV